MVFVFLACLLPLNSEMIHAASVYDNFKGQGTIIGHTNIGEWNGGKFFETLTYEEVGGYDPGTKTSLYRFRYYITHKGPSSSYTYQTAPVQVLVNGNLVGEFNIMNIHITNKTYFGGQIDVRLKPGVKYQIIMRDNPKYTGGNVTQVNMKKDIYFELPKYTVTFKDYNGTNLKTQTVEKYSAATAPSSPSRVGYTFTGWDKAFNYITSDLTVNAQYRINQYTATFNGNGGTPSFSSIVRNYGAQLGTLPTASRTGYSLSGWYTAASGGSQISSNTTMPAYNPTYYAHWNLIKYKINYNLNDGTNSPANPPNYTIESGDIVLKDPSKPGYKFIGWTGSNGSTPQKNVKIPAGSTGDKSYVAHWDKYPSLYAKDFKVIEGDDFPVSNLIAGKGYITQGTSEFPEKLVEVTYPVTADDQEDGAASVTGKVKVESVIGPNGEKLSNVDTSKIGNYKVTYSVTDSAGSRVEATRTITVLPSSTAEILADDRYFYRGSEITSAILKEKIIARDKYDGIITDKVEIPDLDNINNEVSGTYEITYKVTNRSHKTTTKKVKIYIIDTITDLSTPYDIRFISSEFINTVNENSKWRTNSQLNQFLSSSMKKDTKEEAVAVFEFSNKDIQEIKKQTKNEGFSQQQNKNFMNDYQIKAKTK